MAGLRTSRSSGSADQQRGLVFPSPLVMLSVVAVAMAAIAFFATRGGEPTEREVATPSAQTTTASTATTTAPSSPTPTTSTPVKAKPPKIVRGEVYVEVYNNSGISGLAGRVGSSAAAAGWQVVGTDNWYGSIPTNTVYYPQRLERAAKLLALDLGVARTAPSVGAMKLDRLTVILTAEP